MKEYTDPPPQDEEKKGPGVTEAEGMGRTRYEVSHGEGTRMQVKLSACGDYRCFWN